MGLCLGTILWDPLKPFLNTCPLGLPEILTVTHIGTRTCHKLVCRDVSSCIVLPEQIAQSLSKPMGELETF